MKRTRSKAKVAKAEENWKRLQKLINKKADKAPVATTKKAAGEKDVDSNTLEEIA